MPDSTPHPPPPVPGRSLRSLRGPRGWPWLGNLPQLDATRLHVRLEDWARTYGPLYRVDFGRADALVVARTDLIAAILRDRPDGWRRLRSMQSVIRELGGHGLFSAEGDDWRRQRRLVMRAFDPAHLQRFFPSLVRVTERFMARLERAADDGETLDLQALLMRYTVDVTAGLAFGVDVNTQEASGDPLQAHLDQVFPMLMKRIFAPLPWWRWVRLPSDRRFDRHLAAVHEAIAGFLRAARERMAREPARRDEPTDLLEALIAAHDESGGLSEAEVVGNVMTVLLAGEDTTANTLAWTLHLLARHPDVRDALVRDVDAALGGAPFPRTFDDTRALDAIERCVAESMRLHPVAPLTLVQNNRDTTVGDVSLPRGTTVVCLMRPGAIDASVADDAAAFRPDRTADAGDAAQRTLAKASMPFGAGPRLCPGRYLAMLEMKMVLATILRNFEIVDVRTRDGAPPAERLEFTMYPVGLTLRIARRRNDGRDTTR